MDHVNAVAKIQLKKDSSGTSQLFNGATIALR